MIPTISGSAVSPRFAGANSTAKKLTWTRNGVLRKNST
jgi:hypothetical protein